MTRTNHRHQISQAQLLLNQVPSFFLSLMHMVCVICNVHGDCALNFAGNIIGSHLISATTQPINTGITHQPGSTVKPQHWTDVPIADMSWPAKPTSFVPVQPQPHSETHFDEGVIVTSVDILNEGWHWPAWPNHPFVVDVPHQYYHFRQPPYPRGYLSSVFYPAIYSGKYPPFGSYLAQP